MEFKGHPASNDAKSLYQILHQLLVVLSPVAAQEALNVVALQQLNAILSILLSLLENSVDEISFIIRGPTKVPPLILLSDNLGMNSRRYLKAAG